MTNNVLFLPFMLIPTGHHHVADTLIEDVQKIDNKITTRKIDILSYSYGKMEKVVSQVYLRSIKLFPQMYHELYRYLAYTQISKRKRHFHYEALFMHFFKQMMKENHPSIIFCTHCLPSNIASVLKQKQQLQAVTVNVYTDYFVNRVWGIRGIDYHFVPSLSVKEFLMELGVDENRIFMTGIPVHSSFLNSSKKKKETSTIHVLVTGGSLGVGAINQILPKNKPQTNLHYYVLCGKNETLYQQLVRQQSEHITPISYIQNKEEMNHLYDQVDAVVTKPGGVTVSECLMKRKPIFVYGALPGQEKINVEQLERLGVVIPLQLKKDNIENQIMNYFSNKYVQSDYDDKITTYHQTLTKEPIPEIIRKILRH